MVTGEQLSQEALKIFSAECGYIWGTAGVMWTREKQTELEHDHAGDNNYAMAIKYGSKWIGHIVYDCSGLILALLKAHGIKVPHGSNSQWNNSLSEKGTIEGDIPVGSAVFKVRNGNDYYHVGIYVGNGMVVEARGTTAGVVESRLSSWTHYGLLKGVTYSKDDGIEIGSEAIVDVPNDGTLNVRAKPSLTSRKTDVIYEGEKVEVLEQDVAWAKIRYTKEGYVMKKYLKAVE